jgi:ATP-dependent RNA helicase HelY
MPLTTDAAALVDEFAAGYPFALDEFQRRGCRALAEGRGTLVAAPTGAGKTVVGEFAAWLAIRSGGKAFYTTPLKALSNQKFGDFVARHGPDNVGLLTGDNSINGDAPVVVMTTEVLRNMLYEGASSLSGLRFAVMDEVHYLQDRVRGAVWEEVLINLPVEVKVASLSATVSNAEEFGEWLSSTRGPTEVVIEETRPVPLTNYYLVGRELHPLFADRDGADPVPNPALSRLPTCGSPAVRSVSGSGSCWTPASPTSTTPTWTRSATPTWPTRWSGGSPPTTPGCCRCSRRRSRTCSRPGW